MSVSKKQAMQMFDHDLGMFMDEVRGLMAHYRIADWEAYLFFRKPECSESYVLKYEATAGDKFAKQIVELHAAASSAPAERTRAEGEQEFGDSFVAAVNAIKAISEDRRATAIAMLASYFAAAAPADHDAESLRAKLPSPAQQALQIVTTWRAVVGGDDLLIHYIKQAIEENRATTTKGER